MRLSAANADRLPATIGRPGYDRLAQATGIVHFGIGAFHRAHQAVYTDAAMTGGDRDWAITGVSLRSAGIAAQLNPQDGLFTVTADSPAGSDTRLIGSVRTVLVAAEDPAAVVAALASPDTHIVTFTITEKGYCRAADGSLDADAAGPGSFYDLLTAAFRLRQSRRLSGLTLVSCDNLADNGTQLARLMADYLDRHAPDMLDWFRRECACPSTMVDRIVPAMTAESRDRLAAHLGMRDEGAILTEAFCQWVIEDRFAGPRPRWDIAGARFTADVRAFETAKLRMLNGAHSALAYLGLARGHDYVHQAIADPVLAAKIDRLLRREAMTSLSAAPEQDLDSYATELVVRFANPAVQHRLIQIAMDGSQKIPQRWLETLAHHQPRGQSCPILLEALAAWLVHVEGSIRPVEDPMAPALAELWRRHGKEGIVQAVFGPDGHFAPVWQADPASAAAIAQHL